MEVEGSKSLIYNKISFGDLEKMYNIEKLFPAKFLENFCKCKTTRKSPNQMYISPFNVHCYSK